MQDAQHVLMHLNFGRVDGETDNRFEQCFIGTEMLRQVLLPQHSLVVGNKGSGKSAMCRLLVDDLQKVKPLLPKNYNEILCVPAYGIQSEENLPNVELRELTPETVDEFRYFWLLYLGLKLSSYLLHNKKMSELIEKNPKEEVKKAHAKLKHLLVDVGLIEENSVGSKISHVVHKFRQARKKKMAFAQNEKYMGEGFQQKTGVSIMAMLEAVDLILRETNSLAWVMLDKLDLLYVDDIKKLRASITGLVQLLVQYGNQFKNIQFKIFLRNDIYRQLHIVNKSHLITYTTEMKWRGPLLLKLLVSRAVVDPHVREYCEEMLGEPVDVTNVIVGSDEYVLKLFNVIFESNLGSKQPLNGEAETTHQWILKRLVDGMGNSFPRELIHLGNRAVEKQREMNRMAGGHASTRLISAAALKEAFHLISQYRCDTYLYSEFPHLTKHIDVFRGSESAVFHREELYMLFEPLMPHGDDAIRQVFDVGLLQPLGTNVDSCRKFKIPPLYRSGLGITERKRKLPQPKQKRTEETVAA